MLWELVFMLVILKIPVVYLCAVVWWAIRAEPRPLEGAARPVAISPTPLDPECDWRARRARALRGGPTPRGGRAARARRVALARAQTAR